jgi:methylthioribose-1-phosphate isomerase
VNALVLVDFEFEVAEVAAAGVDFYFLDVVAQLDLFVAAPLSTVDFQCPDGSGIPIEERDPEEVTRLFGTRIAPEGVQVRNPAFDVTPARYIAAIVTERGIARPPYGESLRELRRAAERE